jgi:phage shock protein PspC (stress-responsive transcriptional regulator)
MTCSGCGRDIGGDFTFCPHCGAKQSPGVPAAARQRKLVRLPAAGRLGGVCAGIADYLDTDVTLIRLAWILLAVIPGAVIGGIIAYVAVWILVPESNEPIQDRGRSQLYRSTDNRRLGGVCGGIAEYLSLDATVIRVAWVVLAIVPGAIVFGVLAYLVAWFIMPTRPNVSLATTTATASS